MRQTVSLLTTWALLAVACGATAAEAPKPNTPPEGFSALFNGRDLTNWKTNAATLEHWKVEDGVLHYDGKASDLVTARDYENFILYLDWKITKQGDSGIYLRGQPQVQIWDNQEGSGGLWNNKEHSNKPLLFADKPIGEWNTFQIKLVGENVTVHLNGKLVVDNLPMDTLKGRKAGPIFLQNHGTELWFRNVFLKELPGTSAGIIAPGAKLQKLAGDFSFTEGPASDRQGNVYFTDQPNDRILKWSTDGKLSTFMQPCGRSNGLCFDSQGKLWACADEKNELWCIDSTGKSQVVVKDFEGKLLNGPNDIWLRPDSGIYFTDPYYKRPYWKRGPKEIVKECVYYLTPDHKKLTCVVDDLKQPNGIIGTADGKALYVADIGAGKTYSYAVQPEGPLTNKKLFCEMGSDGMTIDSAGNVYLTGRGVTVFDKTGKQIEHIDVPEGWTANACFGGADQQTLFITASKGLYAIRTQVRGAGSQ